MKPRLASNLHPASVFSVLVLLACATMPAVARVSLSSLGEPLFLVQLTMARSEYIMSKQLTDVLDDRIITSIA